MCYINKAITCVVYRYILMTAQSSSSDTLIVIIAYVFHIDFILNLTNELPCGTGIYNKEDCGF